MSATVKQDGELWWCSIQCEIEISDPVLKGEPDAVGLDLGLNEFLTTSDGETFTNPRFNKNTAKKLKKAQQKQARKRKGSQNNKKAKIRVQKIHRKIRDQRNSFHHNISRYLVNNYDIILTEDLCIKGMMKTRMAKSIGDAGWGEFLRQLKYKAAWAGKNHTRIGRFEPSSQLCSACGSRQKLTLAQRTYKCGCGLVLDRDLNAAINIKQIGLTKIGMCHAEFTPVEIPLMEVSVSTEASHVSPKQEVHLAPVLSG